MCKEKCILSPEEVQAEKDYLVNVFCINLFDSDERDDRKDGHRKLAKKYWPEVFENGIRIEVHHINGDHSDNRLCNVVPLTRKQHAQIHSLFFEEYSDMLQEQWKSKRCDSKGEHNGFYNKSHTAETAAQISESLKEYWRKKKEGLI